MSGIEFPPALIQAAKEGKAVQTIRRVRTGALHGLCVSCKLDGNCGVLTMTRYGQMTPRIVVSECSLYDEKE